MRRYKLVDRAPVPLLGSEPEEEVEVASDSVSGIEVRTKFLGHATATDGHMFETMVYRNPPPYSRWSWATWDEAVKGHAEVVVQVRRMSMRVVR
jgi:hypothetical protein